MTTAPIIDAAYLAGLCDRWQDAWNALDGDAVAALCSDDLVYDEPALGDTRYGPEQVRAHVLSMAEVFAEHSFTRVGLYLEVERPAMVVAWRFQGRPANTERSVAFHGDDRLEVGPDGLIRSYRGLYDNRLVRRQLREAMASAR